MVKHGYPPDVVLIYPKTGLDLGSTVTPPFPLLTIAALLLKRAIRVRSIAPRVDKTWSQQLRAVPMWRVMSSSPSARTAPPFRN